MALNAVEQARAAAFKDVKANGWKYLQLLEADSIHKPRDVTVIGKQLLDNKWVSTANKWRLLERVAICALELEDKGTAKECIRMLTDKFTRSSNRVRVLRGMFYETKEEQKRAQDEYNFVLEAKNNPNHMMAKKRRVALLIAERRITEAIKELCAYLTLYGSDREAWKQLIVLYADMHCYELAKFCIEELITMTSDNYLMFQFYAEMLYNMGGQQHCTNALKYFSQALLLSSDQNTRSLWGVVMCVRSLKDKSLTPQDKELIANCREKIVQNYADSKSKLVDTVKNVLMSFDSEQ